MSDAQDLPARIEELLDRIAANGDDQVTAAAEDLVAAVVTLYGHGLARVVEIVGDDRARRLAADDVVGPLLLLHDLHPDDVETRIQAALDGVRPYLGRHSGGIEFRGLDADGIAHLRLQGSCDSCPSSAATIQGAVERAVLDAAPEVVGLDVEGLVAPTNGGGLVQITRRPEFAQCSVPAGS